MIDDMRVVFESRNRRACADRSLVLAAANIPHRIVEDPVSCALVVPAEFSAEAANELRLYDEENPPQQPRKVQPYRHLDAMPGIAGYIVAVVVFAYAIGAMVGATLGFFGGRVDMVVTFIITTRLAMPVILVALAVVSLGLIAVLFKQPIEDPELCTTLLRIFATRAASEFGDESRWRELTSNLPMGRAASVPEVADVVVFAASDRAAYLSGIVINVDGGHGQRGGSFSR